MKSKRFPFRNARIVYTFNHQHISVKEKWIKIWYGRTYSEITIPFVWMKSCISITKVEGMYLTWKGFGVRKFDWPEIIWILWNKRCVSPENSSIHSYWDNFPGRFPPDNPTWAILSYENYSSENLNYQEIWKFPRWKNGWKLSRKRIIREPVMLSNLIDHLFQSRPSEGKMCSQQE